MLSNGKVPEPWAWECQPFTPTCVNSLVLSSSWLIPAWCDCLHVWFEQIWIIKYNQSLLTPFCYCADCFQLSLVLSFIKWGCLLSCLMEWGSVSVTFCILSVQKVYLIKNIIFHVFCKILRLFIFLLLIFCMFFEANRHFTLRVEPDGVHDLIFMAVFVVRYECIFFFQALNFL